MKKILLTGGSGFVGSRFLHRWRGSYDIVAPTHAELDITDSAAVSRYVGLHRPDVVLHAAAISNTGYCQEHPDESHLVNTIATTYLAKAAKDEGARFVFFSSDQVYNGNTEQGLLHEDLAVSPVNHYGCHKLEAEQRVMELMPEAVALRATWMYDIHRPGMPVHPDFHTNICQAIDSRQPLRFAIHEHRGITHIAEVVDQLPDTFLLPGGVYNYGSENTMCTYDTAFRFVEGWKGSDVASAVIKADNERFATQPRNISISLDKITYVSKGRIRFNKTLDGLLEWGDEQVR